MHERLTDPSAVAPVANALGSRWEWLKGFGYNVCQNVAIELSVLAGNSFSGLGQSDQTCAAAQWTIPSGC